MITYYVLDGQIGNYKQVTYYVFYSNLRSLKKTGSDYILENRYYSGKQEKRLIPYSFRSPSTTCGTWKKFT